MYENSLRIAKKIEAIADEIDNDERFEFDDNAECLFMEMIGDTLRQHYEMILMYIGKLKDKKLLENDLATIKKSKLK